MSKRKEEIVNGVNNHFKELHDKLKARNAEALNSIT
jgi:hypothetical protein